MAILDIVKYPDDRLRQVSEEITVFDDELKTLIRDMTETMYANNGAGLAAIQVGVAKRLFIVEAEAAGQDPSEPPIVFINPEIISLGEEKQKGDEGCLSFPGIFVPVERAMSCKMKALDAEGNPFEAEGNALFARAMQHETDHLNAKLLIDFVGRIKKKMIERRLAREQED